MASAVITAVEKARRKAGLTQGQLAKIASVAPLVVWKMENRKGVRRSSCEKVAKALGIPLKTILVDFARNCDNAS